jgi:hypothetical protein
MGLLWSEVANGERRPKEQESFRDAAYDHFNIELAEMGVGRTAHDAFN